MTNGTIASIPCQRLKAKAPYLHVVLDELPREGMADSETQATRTS
jgi:hypothetical protein